MWEVVSSLITLCMDEVHFLCCEVADWENKVVWLTVILAAVLGSHYEKPPAPGGWFG